MTWKEDAKILNGKLQETKDLRKYACLNHKWIQHQWYCPCWINLQGQTVGQAYYAEILKHLWDYVLHKSLLDHPFYSLHFSLNNFGRSLRSEPFWKEKISLRGKEIPPVKMFKKRLTPVPMAIPIEKIQNTWGSTWNYCIALNVTYLKETILP